MNTSLFYEKRNFRTNTSKKSSELDIFSGKSSNLISHLLLAQTRLKVGLRFRWIPKTTVMKGRMILEAVKALVVQNGVLALCIHKDLVLLDLKHPGQHQRI